MKAIEILAESKKIDEAPASTLGTIGRRVGAGVLGALGLNTWAKGLNDKADIGTFSNRYYREFQSYLKSQGRTEQGATFADLKAFLDQNKIPSGRVPANTEGTVDAAMVNAILNRTATDFLKGTATASPSGAPAAQQPAQDTQQPQQAQAPAPQGASRRITATNPSGTFTPPAQQSQSAPAGASIDSLISAVSRMKKADLQKLDQAVKAALTKPARPAAARPGATAQPAPAQQTPAQIRADKQRTAAANAQAQMAANPAPAKAPVVTPQDAIAQTRATKQAAAAKNAQAQMAANPVTAKEPVKTPDQIRAEKQAVAAKMAQDQMAASPAPGPKVWKNNRNPSAPATSRPTKPKKAVAV